MEDKRISKIIFALFLLVIILYKFDVIAMHNVFGIISLVILLLAYIFSNIKIKIPKKNLISLIISIVTVISVFITHFIISFNPFVYNYKEIDGGIEITDYEVCILNNYRQEGVYIEIPSEINGQKVKSIGKRAFSGSSRYIKDLIIPEGVEIINEGAFYDVEYETLKLPTSLKRIGYVAFANYKYTAGYVILPEKIEYISPDAFRAGVKYIIVPSSVNTENWPKYWATLEVCYDVVDVLTIEGVDYALKTDKKATVINFSKECSSVNLVEIITHNNIEYHVTTIGKYASSYRNLKEIVIPSFITIIKEKAFTDHWSFVEYIYIPETVLIIEKNAFGCLSIKIDVEYDEKPESWDDEWYVNEYINWGAKMK